MTRKYTRHTTESFNQLLLPRGIQLVGEYIKWDERVLFCCTLSHQWLQTPHSIVRGYGCPVCVKNKILTKEDINISLKSRGIELIGDYTSTQVKSLFRGSCNHEWLATPNNILRGSGCHECRKYTKEHINERIADRGMVLVGEYTTVKTKTRFVCVNNHEWEAIPSHILRGRGCPKCAYTGFNQSKAAHAYILDFGFYIKYGITNDLSTRLDTHRRNNGDYILVETREYNTGYEAKRWENEVKIKFGGRHATKEQCPDGYTETLSPEMLQELIDFTFKR